MLMMLRNCPWSLYCNICIMLLLLAEPFSVRSGGPAKVLNPKTYSSPSGEYTIHVNPSDIYGRNGATYRLSKMGEELWTRKMPFTLRQVGVTDDGVIAGYSYSNGPEGFATDRTARSAGTFNAIIIDAAGDVRCNDSKKRTASRFPGGSPNPQGRGVIVDASNDRFVIRVSDPDINRNIETWFTYRLSTGKPTGELKPKNAMRNIGDGSIIRAVSVVGTPLTLVHWWRYRNRKRGATFALVDLQGKPVWTQELADDYEIPGDEQGADRLQDLIWKHGAIFPTIEANQFQLYFASDSQKVRFSVSSAKQGNRWVVKEVDREPVTFTREPPARPVAVKRPLELKGTLELQPSKSSKKSDIQRVSDFVIDDKNRISFLRENKNGTTSLILVDTAGTTLKNITVPNAGKEETQIHHAWVGGEQYVVTRSGRGIGAKSEAWRIDAETEKSSQLKEFHCAVVEAISGCEDGSFVVLATTYYSYTNESDVFKFDSTGTRQWSLPKDHSNYPQSLFSPQSVTVTSDGNVAVVDGIKLDVQIFDSDGKFLRLVDLTKSWGRKPNYASDIASDKNGGIVLLDFNGKSPLVRMKEDETVAAELRPKHKDGRLVDPKKMKVAPNGSLWVSDGHTIMELDASATVTRTLGSPPDPKQLKNMAAITLDKHGCIYVADSRTGAVHVFEKDGALRHVCQTLPTDVSEELYGPALTVTDSGEVFLCIKDSYGETSNYVHFSPKGKRLGIVQLKSDDWLLQPDTENGLALQFRNALLVNPDGKTLRTIRRSHDGNWLETIDSAAFAPDGSFVIAANQSSSNGNSLTVYDKNANPVKTLKLPENTDYPNLTFDGTNLVIGSFEAITYCDINSGEFFQFSPQSQVGKQTNWTPFFVPGVNEIVVFDGASSTLRRYKTPGSK